MKRLINESKTKKLPAVAEVLPEVEPVTNAVIQL